MAVSGYISGRSFKLHKTCQSGVQTRNILFGKIFRHVALLVTEISRQNQNFQIIPRIQMENKLTTEGIIVAFFLNFKLIIACFR